MNHILKHHLVGKLAKINPIGIDIETQYEQLFGIGNTQQITNLLFDCTHNNTHLIFINESTFTINNITLYALKEIGKFADENIYWLSLDQLFVSDD